MSPITQKTIFTAIAAPGAGKTEALLSKTKDLIANGKRILLALPTLALSEEIANRAIKKGITTRTINHLSGDVVVPKLEQALQEKNETFIICTHISIQQVKKWLLRDWMLVVDELPKVVDYPDFKFNQTELGRILEYTIELDGQLLIPEDRESIVQQQVNTHRSSGISNSSSTLNDKAARIFRLLLSKVIVHIDKEMPDGTRHIRAVEEFTKWWEVFSNALECHVLAATIAKSEFEVFAEVHGFKFERSTFTPEWKPQSHNITIYPVLPKGKKFSWRLMTAPHDDKRVIDNILEKALGLTTTTPLLFDYDWAKFKLIPGTQYVPIDCRGLNSYSTATEAILLFGGNPSPSEGMGLKQLENQYNRNFDEAFITSKLLERSLQAVTRTAVRLRENTDSLKFIVQDYRVAEYLTATYFPEATIDWSLAEATPVKRDGRKLNETSEAEVTRLLLLGKGDMDIHRQTKVSRPKIAKMRKSLIAA